MDINAQQREQARQTLMALTILAYLVAKALGAIGRFADGKVALGVLRFADGLADSYPPATIVKREISRAGAQPSR
jgi:hypothetical protein